MNPNTMTTVERTSGNRRGNGYAVAISLALVVLFASGCGSLRPRKSVPKELIGQAQIQGYPGARLLVHPMQADLERANRFLTNTVMPAAKSDRALTLLVLSGGGADGAFGAGLLRGWSEAGDRPDFDVVTGISTGALIGPYAFLGKAWDEKLERD